MEILVDYNNVLEVDRRRGIVYLVEKLLGTIGPSRFGSRSRASIRLYDGWYELQSLTRTAQETSADVQANSPRTVQLQSQGTSKTLIVNVELAYSLMSDPTVHLWHTFRPKNPQSNITCRQPHEAVCAVVACPLAPMSAFLSTRTCPESSCNLKPADFVVRNEQKLVDTMIASDLFALHLASAPEAVIVSSDDDLLPAIRMLVKCGTSVIHVLTRPPSFSMDLYLHGLDDKYVQLQL